MVVTSLFSDDCEPSSYSSESRQYQTYIINSRYVTDYIRYLMIDDVFYIYVEKYSIYQKMIFCL